MKPVEYFVILSGFTPGGKAFTFTDTVEITKRDVTARDLYLHVRKGACDANEIPDGECITTYYQATPNRLPEPPVAPTRLDGATTGRRPSRRALAEFAVFITLGLIPLLIALLAH